VKLPAPHDRPREKLARSGVGALGDNELVALVLGTGVRARSALEVAQDVLDLAGGVPGLTQVGVDDLLRVSGIGRTRAGRVMAAVELGRRAISRAGGERVKFGRPSDIGRYLLPLYGGYREERFGIVMLDSKLRPPAQA
jgi:DNA repair protein RadC